MPTTFFLEPRITRIDKFKEISSITSFIKKLHHKQKELFQAAQQNGIGSSDAKKHKVIKKFLEEYYVTIANFNQHHSEQVTFGDKRNLVEKIATLVDEYLSQQKEILLLKRNPAREQAKSLVYGGAFLGSVSVCASSYLSCTPLGSMILVAAISPRISTKITEIVGLDDLNPESFRIFKELSLAVSLLLEKLPSVNTPVEENESDLDGPAELLCPIKVGLMNDPVLCALDGHTYERKFIEKWLLMSKSSPTNLKKMQEGEKIKDVLFTNRAIKSLIDRYIRNPELLASEFKLSR